jgi:hypothetical protein
MRIGTAITLTIAATTLSMGSQAQRSPLPGDIAAPLLGSS